MLEGGTGLARTVWSATVGQILPAACRVSLHPRPQPCLSLHGASVPSQSMLQSFCCWTASKQSIFHFQPGPPAQAPSFELSKAARVRCGLAVRGWPGSVCKLEARGMAFREPWPSPCVHAHTKAQNGPQEGGGNGWALHCCRHLTGAECGVAVGAAGTPHFESLQANFPHLCSNAGKPRRRWDIIARTEERPKCGCQDHTGDSIDALGSLDHRYGQHYHYL